MSEDEMANATTEKVVTCSRCKGVGYHHGFGEHGHDPDWCLECGGIGEWLDDVDIEDARATKGRGPRERG